jgi:hypothetical protein
VCGLEQGLQEGGHEHLRVGLGDPEVLRSIQSKQPLHGIKALFNTETVF